MIAGEYSTTWRTRLRRVGELNAYLTERFTRIMNQLNVLRLSHDALEHDLITQPATLRDALYELRMLMAVRSSATRDELPAAQEILVLLAHHCQLEAAAIYEIVDGSYVQRAKLGEPPPVKGQRQPARIRAGEAHARAPADRRARQGASPPSTSSSRRS